MSTWTCAVSDLRNLLNDGTQDRPFYRKKVFGNIDGTNTSFKTFEFRRLTDFTDDDSSASPLGVFLNGVRIAPTAITFDDPVTGDFTLQTAPPPVSGSQGNVLTASYYVQFFFDSELETFLTNASQSFLQLGPDYTLTPPELRESALQFACSDALLKLSMRWTQRMADSFLLEDMPKKEAIANAEVFSNLAKVFKASATQMRNDSYATRAGKALAPNFKSNFGVVSNVVPRR